MPIGSGNSRRQLIHYGRERGFVRRAVACAAATVAVVVWSPSRAEANKTWIGNTGSFNLDGNWSPTGVPGSSDVIEFNASDLAKVYFPTLTNSTVGGLLEKGGAYAEFHLNGGTLTVNGTISLGQDDFDSLYLIGGTVVVPAGGGSTTLGVNNTGTAQLQVFKGAVFNSSQQIFVGKSGVGTLGIEGQVFNSGAFVGQSSPSGKGNGNVVIGGDGASWTVANTLMVGGMDTSNSVLGFGSLSIGAGGTVSTTLLQITGNAHGEVDLFGGTLSTGSINLFSGGIFNFNAGTLIMTGKDGIRVDDSGLLGKNLTLGPSQNLMFAANAFSYVAPSSTMSVSGGRFSAPLGVLENAGQMSILGSTSVVSAGTFQNDFGGNLLIQDAWPQFTSSFSNTGEIDLSGTQVRMTIPTAAVSAGQNFGLIQGSGRIDGDFTNMAEGEVRVGSGQRIIVYPTVPFSNAGSITLSGDGIFEVQGNVSNAGYITGRGTLYAHSTITNGGTMSLSGGLTDVRGALFNYNRITITGGSTTTFYDPVTNNGNIRIDAGSSAVFLGNVSVGSITGSGTAYYDGDAVGGPIVNTGASVVDSDASLTADYIRQNSLTINGTTSIKPNGASDHFTRLTTLSIPSGNLDLADNDAIIDSTPLATVQSLIQSAYANGAWNGPGITSSLAHAGPGATALGYATASSINKTLFDGQSVSGSMVLIAYTLRGDANLDGVVNALDFNVLATNFGKNPGSQVWSQGDFNYDGTINTADFMALSANFGSILPSASLSPPSQAMRFWRRNRSADRCAWRSWSRSNSGAGTAIGDSLSRRICFFRFRNVTSVGAGRNTWLLRICSCDACVARSPQGGDAGVATTA